MGQEVATLFFSVLAIVVVLVACYFVTKYIAGRANTATSSANIRVLERAALAQDKGMAIVEVTGKYYLIGFSTNGVEILKELPEYQKAEPQTAVPSFLTALKDSITKQKGPNANEKLHK